MSAMWFCWQVVKETWLLRGEAWKWILPKFRIRGEKQPRKEAKFPLGSLETRIAPDLHLISVWQGQIDAGSSSDKTNENKGTKWSKSMAPDFTFHYNAFLFTCIIKPITKDFRPTSQPIACNGKAETEGKYSVCQLWFSGSWAGFILDLFSANSAATQQLHGDGSTGKTKPPPLTEAVAVLVLGFCIESQNVHIPSQQPRGHCHL